MRINQTQPNDLALSYPIRVSVDVKWTEALTSRYVKVIELFLNFNYDSAFFFIRLKILNARVSDSGNYSCVPTMGESSSVMVHVINGNILVNMFSINSEVFYAAVCLQANIRRRCRNRAALKFIIRTSERWLRAFSWLMLS